MATQKQKGWHVSFASVLRPRLLLILALLSLPLALGPALTAAAVGPVTVTVTAEGAPVPGAFVALIGAAGQYAGVSDSSGHVVLANVADGQYTAVASAPGTTVGEASVSVSGGGSVAIAVKPSGNKFHGLGVYGAHVVSIAADGKPGVFYLTVESIPSLFRTADYGGTWAPVTISTDDPEEGIDGRTSVPLIATSGFPGEVAAIANNREGQMQEEINIWYSRDFGVTWDSITATIPIPPHERSLLLWGHKGTTSVLLLSGDNTSDMWYANMPTGENPDLQPALMKMDHSFKTEAGDKLALANGSLMPVVAVASKGGSVTLYELGNSPDAASANKLVVPSAAPASPPTFVRLGGPATGPDIGGGNLTPMTILVYSFDQALAPNGAAVMSSYEGGNWVQTATTVFKRKESDEDDPAGSFSSGPNSCGASSGAIGSVSPLGQAGTVAMCWVTQEGTTLLIRPVAGINNNTGIAFDAGYDGSSNLVLISGDGSFGAVKSASMDANLRRPTFPNWPDMASPGTAPDSGGLAINGLDAAEVKDTVFGPNPGEIVAVLGGGGRMIASTDGGQTWETLGWQGPSAPSGVRSGPAVDWWEGADPGKYLLLAGAGGAGNLLGVLNMDGALPGSPSLTELPQTSGADLRLPGDPEAYEISAIAGIAGTNVAYVAASALGASSAGALRRITLSGTEAPQVSDAGLEAMDKRVSALAYCPADAATSVADKLFVAMRASSQASDDGGIAVFTNVASAPTLAGIPISGDFNEVRVHCGAGMVYAGRQFALPPGTPPNWVERNGLVRSSDGGETFEEMRLDIEEPLAWRLRNVVAIGLNPSNPAELVVVGGGGDIISSADGGLTWTAQNDTRQDWARHFGAPINEVDLPSAPSSAPGLGAAAVTTSDALLASGAGLFSAAVRTSTPSVWRVYVPILLKQ